MWSRQTTSTIMRGFSLSTLLLARSYFLPPAGPVVSFGQQYQHPFGNHRLPKGCWLCICCKMGIPGVQIPAVASKHRLISMDNRISHAAGVFHWQSKFHKSRKGFISLQKALAEASAFCMKGKTCFGTKCTLLKFFVKWYGKN